MFHSSTQKQHWLFKEDDVTKLRKRANESFCEKQEQRVALLEVQEELLLVQYYQKKLVELCNLFGPPNWAPLPRTALTLAVTYFKRFYLHTSVMEYHPQDMYFCCVFLAFKIDEYNVTLTMYMDTLQPFFPVKQLEHISEFILSHELFLLQKLKFHLTVHSPFRPLSGFFIDIKTRTPNFPNPDQLRKEADKFLVLSMHSDVGLLYPPSQVALTALWHSAKQAQNDVEGYMLSVLLSSESPSSVQSLQTCLQKIEDIVLATKLPNRASISAIDEKLSLFRASTSQSRKRKIEGDSDRSTKKHKHSSEIEDIVLATKLPNRASISAIDEKLSLFRASTSQSRKRKIEGDSDRSTKKHKHSSGKGSVVLSGITELTPFQS